MDFEQIAMALSEIQNTGSTLEKEALLREYAELEGFKDVLRFIYDPYFTTGLKSKKLDNAPVGSTDMSPEEFMKYLKDNPTGTLDAAIVANSFIYSYDTYEEQWLAEGIATKDLQIGVSVTTLNKVFGRGFIPKIGIMRGSLCPEEIIGEHIVTEKIDGNRRLIFVTGAGVSIYTRSGKPDTGLIELQEQARKLPKGFVYDTECVAVGEYADSIALRQASASILNKKGIRRGVKALVFDMVDLKGYQEGKSTYNARMRKAMLAAVFNDISSLEVLTDSEELTEQFLEMFSVETLPNIESLPVLGIVDNKQAALDLAMPIWDAGGEGVMLVKTDSPYEVMSSPRKTLLKIKLVNEYKCKCVDVEEGANKYEGMLGAIVVEYNHPGAAEPYLVKVGSGFTDYQRELFWQDSSKVVGKMIEIDSFGVSRNQQGTYSLNCPIFKRIVGDV